MVKIIFSSELQKLTGEDQVELEVVNYQDMISALVDRYPNLKADILLAMAVAIDGEIIHTPRLEKLANQSEVHFLYRISGG
jgi:molybdopterin converting factor small subunit